MNTAFDQQRALRQIRLATAVLIAGLVFSGLTALPIQSGFELGARWFGEDFRAGGFIPGFVSEWLVTAHRGIVASNAAAPFIWYGTDWLAFGHLVIAAVFLGAWKDPVRNRWLFQFGMIACVAVIPWALVLGGIRGIPLWWRAVDSMFGVLGFIPCWWSDRLARRLEAGSA